MENPYESPTSQPQSRESMRSLWKRRLVCPHCHEPRISVGWAYLCHPRFKIRCPGCSERSKVKLLPEVWWKNFMLANILPVSTSLVVLASALWADRHDPFELVDDVMFKWFGQHWDAINSYAQLIICGGILIVFGLTPIILSLISAVCVETRLIAFHSTLLPLAELTIKAPSDADKRLPPE